MKKIINLGRFVMRNWGILLMVGSFLAELTQILRPKSGKGSKTIEGKWKHK